VCAETTDAQSPTFVRVHSGRLTGSSASTASPGRSNPDRRPGPDASTIGGRATRGCNRRGDGGEGRRTRPAPQWGTYSPQIAVQLRKRRCDVVAVIERGWEHEDDEPLLALCAGETRALLTNNVADFTVIARRWALEGRQHAGLIFTSDASLPRGRHTIGRYVTALQALVRANPADNAFIDRVHWL